MAKCNAGHGCRIECPAGCGAIYSDVCVTWCEPNWPDLSMLKDARSFSVDIHDMPVKGAAQLLEIHGGLKARRLAEASDRKISLTLESTDLARFTREVMRQLR